MVGTVVYICMYAQNREATQNTSLCSLFDTFAYSRDIFLRDRTADERAQGQPQGRNEPGELPRIAAVVAGLRGIPVEELAAAVYDNTLAALPRLAALVPAR